MDDLSTTKIPSSWVIATLNDVAQWGSGGTPSRRSPHFYEGSIPWIKTGELGSKYIRGAEEHITEEAILKSSAKVFPAGSVGIAMYGATIGKLSIWAIDASTNQACAVAQPHEDVLSNQFLYYFLLSEKRGLIEAGKGGAQPNISQGILKDWPISLPPINEQHRTVAKIEELFSELDKGIESLKTARDQLKVYRQAVLKHAFEGKLTAQWREENRDKLETAHQLLARIRKEREAHYQQQVEEWKTTVKAREAEGEPSKKKPSRPKKPPELTPIISDHLPALPAGWLWLHVSDVLELPPTNGRSVKDRSDGFPVLRLTALRGGKMDLSENKRGDWSREQAAPFLVCEGDFLLSRGNGSKHLVGQGRLASRPVMEVAFPDTMIRLRVNSKIIHPDLFSLLWNSRTIRDQIESVAHTTAGIYKINQGHINGFTIPVTCLFEQGLIIERLEETISKVDALAFEIDQRLRSSEALRQSILKKAFSGQLVPQDPNDEPASVLLEQIKSEKTRQARTNKKNKRRNAA